MKKFLKKKGVKFSFLAAAIAFLILYVCLLVRPVTTITPYVGKTKTMGVTYDISYTFKGGNKLEVKSESKNSSNKAEMWVGYDVYSFIIGPDTDLASRSEAFKELKKYKEDFPKLYEKALVDINAFRIKSEGEELVNYGAIVFAVVGAMIEAALVVFTVLGFKK